MPKHVKRKISDITVPDGRRSIDQRKVQGLAESIALIGLINPISIDKNNVLIAGGHRLEAHKHLGRTEIKCVVLDCDELRCRLVEIDENLLRNDLDPIAIGEQAILRDEILEAMGLRAKSGGTGANQHKRRGEKSAPLQTTAGIAHEIGISERSLQICKQLARSLTASAKAAVRKIDAPKQDALKLARKNHKEQEVIAKKILNGKAATIADAICAVAQHKVKANLKSIARELATKKTKNVNRIVCGDAIEIMRQIPDGSVDLIITSPPYNVRDSSGNVRWGGTRATSKMRVGYDLYSDDMPRDEYVAWQRECLSEMMRLIPDTGVIFYNHKWRVLNLLMEDQSPIVEGFPVRQVIIWHRTGGINFNNSYFLPNYEVIYLIAKPKFKLIPGANGAGSVWRLHHDTDNAHPCPFPIELPHRIIASTAAKVVLDCFAGSGTTAVAAKMLGRDYIGIESSAQYVAMAEERLRKTNRKPA